VTLHVVGAVARSDVGHVREGNEDSAYAGSRLLAVADGMGGHAAGEVASRVTIAALARLDEDAPGGDLLSALHDAVDEANATIRAMVAAEPDLAGMGTTLTALLASGQRLGLVHIGDSRAYLLRDGTLTQITHDHTYVQDLIDAGEITPEEATHHPRRSLILKALDGREEAAVDLRVREAKAGDRYLLCSDGLSGVVSDDTIREQLLRETPDDVAQALIDLALRAGGPDNITVVVADVTDDAAQPSGEPQVAGAAALDGGPSRSRAARLSSAGRAALAVRPRFRRHGEHDVPPPTRRRRRLLRPAVLVPAFIVVLLGGAYLGARAYLDAQYYVGADKGGEVVINNGLEGSLAGLSLHHVVQHTGVRVADLTEASARQVLNNDLTAGSRNAALRLVNSLQRKPSPSPTPSPSPSATPSAPAGSAPATPAATAAPSPAASP
jgi:protein phosphatase